MYTSKLNSWNWKDNDSQQESPFFHGTHVHLLNRCITYICRYTFLGRLRKYLQNNIMRPHLMNRGEKFYRGTSCEAANGSKSNCWKKKEWWPLLDVSTPLFNKKKLFGGEKKLSCQNFIQWKMKHAHSKRWKSNENNIQFSGYPITWDHKVVNKGLRIW